MPELTNEQWLAHLEQKLAARSDRLKMLQDYYRGEHPQVFSGKQWRETFGDLLRSFSTNWCGLVVDTPVERMQVQGFRFGADEADEDAWAIWQANNLDARSIQAHTEMGKFGYGYLLVGPRGPLGQPRISVEHPEQFIVETDPADPMVRLAALKRYKDFNGDHVAVLYLPDRFVTFRSVGAADRLSSLGVVLPVALGGWRMTGQAPNPIGVVPGIPLENMPDLLIGGYSDLEPAMSLNDAANKFFSDMIVASEFQAFRQRVLTGVEVPEDENGDPIVSIELAVNRVLMLEGENAKAFEFAAGDVENYTKAIDLAVKHLAAQTRTPPHYLLAELVNISADALKAAEAGLLAKVRRKMLDAADPWEEALRLAFRWRARRGGETAEADLQRAMVTDAEVIWRDPEQHAPGVISDSLVKKQQIGVPWQTLMEEAGYSPQQIKRMKLQRDRELQEAEALALFRGLPDENGAGGLPDPEETGDDLS